MRTARWLILAACVILIGTAVLHATGYRTVIHVMMAGGANVRILAIVKALWIMFTAHLLILSVLLFVASGGPFAWRFVLVCALIPAADTVLLLRFAGVFIGPIALAVVAVLTISGALLLRTGVRPGAEQS